MLAIPVDDCTLPVETCAVGGPTATPPTGGPPVQSAGCGVQRRCNTGP